MCVEFPCSSIRTKEEEEEERRAHTGSGGAICATTLLYTGGAAARGRRGGHPSVRTWWSPFVSRRDRICAPLFGDTSVTHRIRAAAKNATYCDGGICLCAPGAHPPLPFRGYSIPRTIALAGPLRARFFCSDEEIFINVYGVN